MFLKTVWGSNLISYEFSRLFQMAMIVSLFVVIYMCLWDTLKNVLSADVEGRGYGIYASIFPTQQNSYVLP